MSPQESTQVGSTPVFPAPANVPLPRIEGYEVLSLLGRGGMGRVYKARHDALGRIVAIKMLIDATEEMLVVRFHTECQAVAQLQHPHIAQVFETGQIDGQPYLVLEYVEGGSLAQKLAGKPQPSREAAEMVEILARAIQHSTERGIVHRDLKPANILLAGDGTPKITDFGLAKRLNEDTKLTRTGDVLGTPGYMAPEQASGMAANVGPAVDIYALGAILYEMLTGRPPFQGPDTMQTLMMVLTMEPVPPRRLLPKLPRDVETICLKCLEKTPRKRYGRPDLLADDLRRYLDGRPILARPVRFWERALKWARRHPAGALLILVSVASVLALVAGFLQIRAANERLLASNRQTQESLTVARVAIDRMLVRLSDQLAPLPQSEQVRRESLEDARKLYEKITSMRPGDRDGRSDLASALGKLGQLYGELGQLDTAEATYRKALALHADLQIEEPAEADHRRGHAGVLLNLANLERRRGRLESTEALARSALGEIEPLVAEADVTTLQAAATMHNTLALVLATNKKLDAAAQEHEAALVLRRRRLQREPADEDAKAAVAASLSNLAGLRLVQGRPAEAVGALAEAEEFLTGQSSPQQRFFLGQSQANRGVAFELLKKEREAEAAHTAALATFASLAGDYASVPDYAYVLAKEHLNLVRFLGLRGRSREALPHVRAAGPALDKLVQRFPDNRSFRVERDFCRQLAELVETDLTIEKKKQP